jgi:RNA polymerase sigma-70 factor, ECF subfamily
MGDARRAAEAVARDSYGRLLALVAARTRDLSAAEDALADAFGKALELWPVDGVPDRPEGWLLTVARRSHGHSRRHGAVKSAAVATLRILQEEAGQDRSMTFPDARLKLMFVCAHPAIDEAARTPLMLQTVLGLDAARIAAAFVTSPGAMAQRLVRAKTKIRDAGIGFEEPEPEALPQRLSAVLSAVYAAFGSGWDEALGTGLTEEAIFLGRLLVQLAPGEPEAKGLLALMLYCEARRPARRGPDGAFVPLAEQDVGLWSRALVQEAEHWLRRAAETGVFGRFQAEAAIQSVHVQQRVSGRPNPDALVTLYDMLAQRAPSLGVLVSRAAAYGGASGPLAGLSLLDQLPAQDIGAYQPYWAVRAHLLAQAGRPDAAQAALQRAIGLTDDPAVRAYLATGATLRMR